MIANVSKALFEAKADKEVTMKDTNQNRVIVLSFILFNSMLCYK